MRTMQESLEPDLTCWVYFSLTGSVTLNFLRGTNGLPIIIGSSWKKLTKISDNINCYNILIALIKAFDIKSS